MMSPGRRAGSNVSFKLLDKTFSGRSALVSCKCFLPILANGRKNGRCPQRIQGGMVHCSLGRGRPSIKTGQIGIHSAFVQKHQVFRHLRFYDFFPFPKISTILSNVARFTPVILRNFLFEYPDTFSYFILPFYHCSLFSQEVYSIMARTGGPLSGGRAEKPLPG